MFDKLKALFQKEQTTVQTMSPATRTVLSHLGLKSNQWLPPMSDASEYAVRSGDELYQRLIALWSVVGLAKDPGDPSFREYIIENGMTNWLTDRERNYLFADSPYEKDSVQFSWQAERVYLLCWCAGIVDEIQIPKGCSEDFSFIEQFPGSEPTVGHLRSLIKIRSKEELMRWSDLIYHAHWIARNARLNGKPSPVSEETIMEWHHAINWMLYSIEEPEDWDDVSTDT